MAALQGTVERKRMGGDRATAPIEDIWCGKIRGCGYRRRQHVSIAVRPAQCPLRAHSNQVPQHGETTRWANKRHRRSFFHSLSRPFLRHLRRSATITNTTGTVCNCCARERRQRNRCKLRVIKRSHNSERVKNSTRFDQDQRHSGCLDQCKHKRPRDCLMMHASTA
jgi:hypothetical protein